MKNKLILPLVTFIAIILLVGTTYSAWVFESDVIATPSVSMLVTTWRFTEDFDFAKYINVRNTTNFTASQETTVTQNSVEALRLTSTTGTTTTDHIVNINLDREYYLSEIKYFKFEFDYYHRYKREQYNKGFPKVQFTINNSTLGSDQGGTDTCTDISAFVATPIDEYWWHLEYYVFAHMPTFAKYSDTPIALTKKINGVRINDRTIYDFNGTTAFVIIDNMQFSSEPAPRLGIFNRWAGDSAGKMFWFKVAFAGELWSCTLTTSDSTIAVPEFDPTDTISTSAPFPNGSPFYVQLLSPGTVTITATLELGENHQIFTISNTITVT